ncbi:MAG: hydroxymethylglutaryl-CoA lyase [Solitalea sp.]
MMPADKIELIECPRDAMQGFEQFIPTGKKINYLNQLLQVGFHTLDFGSYVSPSVIPQMRDTAEVLRGLDMDGSPTRLLAIVANERGAREAAAEEKITWLGFPLSVSETFQQRNTNSSISESLDRVARIQELCLKSNKSLAIYLSMGFGNPYGDPWNPETVLELAEQVVSLGVKTISLADTVGVATPALIGKLYDQLIPALPQITWGAHFHTETHNWKPKIEAAWQAGCRRFDGALKGYGGCPMAADTLLGNMATENLIEFVREKGNAPAVNQPALDQALATALEIFS